MEDEKKGKKEEVKKVNLYSRNNIKVEPVTKRNKIGRNQKCSCGSGKKYKYCCLPTSFLIKKMNEKKKVSATPPTGGGA